MSEKGTCPVCGSRATEAFLKRAAVPVTQNVVMADERAALGIARGDLTLAVCGECGFVFNRTFDLSRLGYDENYDNNQTCSPAFRDYVDNLARHLVCEDGVRNCRIVEVGCGQGLFLRRLVEMEGSGNVGCGFDPAYRGAESDLGGRLTFETCYYGPEKADIAADVVVCRHVIEHVPEPLELLDSIRRALSHSPDARVFFETPCVDWILRNQVLWDFFYEHCSYFTADSLAGALASAGFGVESMRHVFGGQYLWAEARLSPGHVDAPKRPGAIRDLAFAYAESESRQTSSWRARIEGLAGEAKVAVWGAGAKGVTFANLVDPDRSLIECIVDMNPHKQGSHIPGSAHPVIDYRRLPDRGVRTVLVTNPNYRSEIAALLEAEHIVIDLIDLMEWGRA